MKKAMITVCGDFGDRHWVSDMLLTTIASLSQFLARHDINVVYADSMDNAQMADPFKGLEIEAQYANNVYKADYLFVLFGQCRASVCKTHQLYEMFISLRGLLRQSTKLYLICLSGVVPFIPAELDRLKTRNDIIVINETQINDLSI